MNQEERLNRFEKIRKLFESVKGEISALGGELKPILVEYKLDGGGTGLAVMWEVQADMDWWNSLVTNPKQRPE